MADADQVMLPLSAPCSAPWRFDDAIALLAEHATPLGPETVRLDSARGRILAEPVRARIDAPRIDVAAMDGYAISDDDVGTTSRFVVSGSTFPGQAPGTPLPGGHVARIFTGAPMPRGADRVIVQEIVDRRGDHAIVRTHPGLKRHVRLRGSDFSIGDTLLSAHRTIDAKAILVAAAADVSRLKVWRRPRIYIMATGDELAWPGLASLTDFDVPDSLSCAVMALAESWGGERAGAAIVPDRAEFIEAQARLALDRSDVLIVTGGASVGDRDLSRRVLASLGLEMIFEKVAIRPGKPIWYGRIGETHVLGLPGNPTAALTTARLFLAPLLCMLTGRPSAAAHGWRDSVLAAPMDAAGHYESFLLGDWDGHAVRSLERQSASRQQPLATANVLIRRMPGAVAGTAGASVRILDF